MARVEKFVLLVALVLSVAGCRGNPQFGTPKLLEPAGSETYQQTRAQRFDPYPDTNIGPNVEGGRPEGYTQPPPEPARGRANQWNAAPAFGS
ncbi:MAG: membrane or secreted protein [Planctomycetia bacterium]|nr:membrane or secreted protein [Planctomycetia bacterium]